MVIEWLHFSLLAKAFTHQTEAILSILISHRQIREVDMGYLGHFRARYFIWALLCFGLRQPCIHPPVVSIIGLRLMFHHFVFRKSFWYLTKLY